LATIQLPPLSPSAPVRTQESSRATLSGGGWLRHTALGWRVRTPWTTPANGGSHGAAPPRNLGVRCGQRPSVHRLQRCRGPSGPRASGAAATPHVWLGTSLATASVGRHGRAPRGTLRTHLSRRRPGRDRQTQSEAAADDHLRCWCRAQGVTHTRTRKAICLAGKICRGERGLSPLHIPSDPTWAAGRGAIVQVREKCCQGHGLLWGWSVHESFSHTKWATFLARPDPFVRTW
jgi:hypothetical protein